ncbi:MAG: MCE family protein [Dechloromonas sp.]|nr:MCE family protein [Dechloromonas sp.]
MSAPQSPPLIPHARAKALLLVAVTLAVLGAFAFFVMTARGVFEETQSLVLVADDSEGVSVGMDLSFSGFPIGRVRRVELAEDAKAHIHIEVPVKDARWLRTSSVFTLERGLVGGTRLRAFSGVLDDPPLADGARRDVLIGDVAERIPQVLGSVQALLKQLEQLSAADGSLARSLDNVQALTAAMNGRHGMLTGLLGNETDARRVIEALERTNRLLAQTETQLYGPQGLADEARRTAGELRAVLGEARTNLEKLDRILADVGRIASNARGASEDLDLLRAEVEASLRRVSGLVEEVNRKWPFARERELKLP